MIAKKNITKIFFIFLLTHTFLWTIIPSISNQNLPLDTIEALAWASNIDWGFSKHPPFSAFVISAIYFIFGSNDWAYYFLSQICVVISFYFIWQLSKDFFNEKIFSLISLFLLETIAFFNYTTPEFNVYVCQLPLKVLTVYFFWKSVNNNKVFNWILLGIFSALGILTHYSFIIIILSLLIFFLFFVKKNKNTIKNFFLASIIFLIILTPHLIWVIENDFTTIAYALNRSGVETKHWFAHFYNPLFFLLKQLGMLSIFIILFSTITSFKKKKKNNFNLKMYKKKKIFLFSISILPIIIVFFISLISGAKIRTMWMSTFYLFFSLFFLYYFKNKIDLKKINTFIYSSVFIFFISPVIYLYVSKSNDSKRTDFQGKEIARLVENKWYENYTNEIKVVVGDEWFAGNLSYHLISRPIWMNDLKNKASKITEDQGVIYVGNPKILKKICPGVFGTIKPVGFCMIGKR